MKKKKILIVRKFTVASNQEKICTYNMYFITCTGDVKDLKWSLSTDSTEAICPVKLSHTTFQA